MLKNIKPEDVLFLDIETVPAAASFDDLDVTFRNHWDRKSKLFRMVEQSASDVYDRAGIYAEFGKIICISAGLISEKDPFSFRVKSFFGDDEKFILKDFAALLEKFSRNREALLCAHNGKEFDYPYIARRMVINNLTLPAMLDNAGKKPWEIHLLDTLDLWRFGDYKSYTALGLLTAILGIPSPKDDIDGSMVSGIYYKEHDLESIVRYCEKDVLAVAQVLLRFMNLPMIDPGRIESVTFHN